MQLLPMRPVEIENHPAGAALTLSRDLNRHLRVGGAIDHLHAITIPAAARALVETHLGWQCIIPRIIG